MRRRRGNIGQLRRRLQRILLTPHKSRVRIFENAITVAEGTQTYHLLRADDDPDYDITTNGDAATIGTNIAECQAKARITSIDLTLVISNLDVTQASEFLLYKDPDVVLGDVAPSTLFTADVTLTTERVRKSTLKYGIVVGSNNTDTRTIRLRVSRRAMMRNAVMNDLDELKLTITNNNTTDDLTIYCIGTITWSK